MVTTVDEIKRPGDDWRDDDGGALPVGTLVRKKLTPPGPGLRKRVRRMVLRVAGLSEPNADGDLVVLYEPTGEIDDVTYEDGQWTRSQCCSRCPAS